MTLVLRTPKDSPRSVEFSLAGYLRPFGENAITAERLAESLPDLQDAAGEPLSGKELKEALAAYAEGHPDVEVADLKNPALDIGPAAPGIREVAEASSIADLGMAPPPPGGFATVDEPGVPSLDVPNPTQRVMDARENETIDPPPADEVTNPSDKKE